MVNLYEKLGISYAANNNEILNAIKHAASKQSMTLEEIQKCREYLLNPEIRAKYDAKLKAEQPAFFETHEEENNTKNRNEGKNKKRGASKKEPIEYKLWHGAAVGVVCFMLGWFGGREYLKYEISRKINEAFAPLVKETPKKSSKPQDKKAEETTASKEETDKIAKSDLPRTWKYGKSIDEMRNSVTEIAQLASLNTINLGFPYENTLGGIIITRSSGSSEKIIFFTTAQVSCSEKELGYKGCVISAKFDDNPVEELIMLKDPENTKSMSISVGENEFLSKLRTAKKLTIEYPIYQNGNQQFNFDVSNFKW